MRLNSWERLLFFINSLMLGGLYYYSAVNAHVWHSLYFYRNTFYLTHASKDWITFLNTGLLANSISLIQMEFAQSFIPMCILVGSLSFIILKYLYRYFNQTLPKQFSLLLLFIITLTPINGQLRQLFIYPFKIDFYGLLFAIFPYPLMMLAGIVFILTFMNRIRFTPDLSITRVFFVVFFLYLVHPFLSAVSVVCFLTQFRISKNLKLINSNFLSYKKVLFFSCSTLIICLVFLYRLYGAQFLGTLTITTSNQFNRFEMIAYVFIPLILLVLSLYVINISLHEIFSKFLPILILFFIEIIFIAVSLISNRNWMLFLDFNGLSAIFHVLYLAPTIYVLLSISRRQRIKWINSANFGDLSEKFIATWLSKIAVILIIIIFSTSLKVNIEFWNRNIQCTKAKQLEQMYVREFSKSSKNILTQSLLVKMKEEVYNDKSFDSFMLTPQIDLPLDSSIYQVCSLDSIGYLILNGFTFNSDLLENTKSELDQNLEPKK